MLKKSENTEKTSLNWIFQASAGMSNSEKEQRVQAKWRTGSSIFQNKSTLQAYDEGVNSRHTSSTAQWNRNKTVWIYILRLQQASLYLHLLWE